LDSIVKMLTASVVVKLVESGRLGLDDPIASHLPDSLMAGLHLYQGREYSDSITVRHLLSHSSGLADDWADPAFLNLIIEQPEREWTPEETVGYIKENCPPVFPPGGGFHYSDPGYNLLGLIIERRTGKELHEVIRELLLDPLGMKHTYRPSHEEPHPSIPGRGPSERYLDNMECTLVPSVLTADWAGGGMISTTEDMNRFLSAFARNEIFDDPSTRDAMFQWIESGPFHNYGFGISRVLFDRSEDPDHAGLGELWGHAGSSHCFAFYWPREEITIVGTLNQLAYESSLYDTLARIMRTILGASGSPGHTDAQKQ
jgi:CubicO group peptidase (beta-lactamase class C family)